ncbi:SH3 domain-containing protein [Mycena alexandri]|uniref:SH3 domain-containing protein n=1 Tax=Mycena alexandri TaxID=1745969 RepID=A0AAD6T976_9AGAR|nr:SH3 domain-containing protein [Mycena alexandri]
MFPAGYVGVLESSSALLRPAPKSQPVKEVSTVVDDGLCAISLHDYQALNEAEMNLKKGDLIKQIKPIGDTNRDWLIGAGTDGRRGMFPASCVKPNKRPKIKVIEGQPQRLVPKSESSLSPLALADRGIVVREHTAGDADEISLTKGELIKQIQRIYGGWWSGVKSSGERGLFPAHYVELERQLSLPAPTVTASDGLCVIAMWDYKAKSEKEQSLAKGDVIKWVNKFEEDWWLGVGATGKTGLFPTVYVKPIESQQTNSGPSVPMAVALSASIAGADDGLCGTVLWDYKAEDDKHLSLTKGDLIRRISKFCPGWWMGLGPSLKTGLFPAGYVKPITSEHRPPEASPISPANDGLCVTALWITRQKTNEKYP